MRVSARLLALPASILLLLASHASADALDREQTPAASWPYNLPAHVESRSEDIRNRRRAVEENLRLGRKPVGVMKMSQDEGEKFYMEYWQFEGNFGQKQTPMGDSERKNPALRGRALDEREQERLAANSSAILDFRPPFVLHTEDSSPASAKELRLRDSKRALTALQKRGFTCPTGTASCGIIGFPGSCCSTNEVCFQIEDTGLGQVGCCPAGATCGGTITQCDVSNTPCSAALGGGCCIPNYVCVEGGCVIDPSLVVTTVITQTFTITASSSTSLLSTALPTIATGVPPIRPTSGSSSDPAPTTCPTGFYACEAYYEGGCCRTGRNCEKTSCPPTPSTTIIDNGVTIVVPVGPAATVAMPTGNCAAGWATCAASLGGNCCPSGWACGTASCSSVGPTETHVAQKASPGSAGRKKGAVGLVVGVGCLAAGLVGW
ncbi:hypothetical protein MBM_04560 [Drepanopeziza brunnea f. sp. 'multigermtubi' MB_m1]|uniref:GPI anchored protein n=1 Tax=Marssonina brunnea f. sp. multigermtubi (strain MB_m1) TaxID=1072389 RepID=K1X8G6_MARBU|nr:uncharacterized protein MBM_04560 [Drepanopeziza brunnea f. sp. 'multigermtubi' MB_m1]EKD16983.1 hypothetical protein MBM_04560 [Drepanopeziza brunnea f. sp. 'multigermtubi' MB_m1]